MRRYLFIFFAILVSFAAPAKEKDIPTIFVDKKGVMRRTDTRQECSFFGVNYTLPFAHAYRAMGYLGIDRKEAIDRDVYHMARLGINAYRIHIWDVEIADAEGGLKENEHLDLLDYLIYKLRQRGIYTLITAQTNFGNGYPERNVPTGAYSYLYDKCGMHEDARCVEAQERYLAALVNHMNPYTGQAYKDEPCIVGFEINNEPCHTGSKDDTRRYIDRMLRALKQAGNRKPVFYNVSHNRQVVEAYYQTAIQGTTYQWYPTGLVNGRMRRGNFLPYVDRYDIPFSDVKGFDDKARLVYEFDPADVLYPYLYAAMTRTLRTEGFQWATQFAYDPIDMAAYNTEYQTHYLNTAYTPQKAVGLMIAAEAFRRCGRGERFGSYPADTLFGNFRLSHALNLCELNDGERFYHSGTTLSQPKDIARLASIAGVGSSPVAAYEGTGMYWIDKLEEGVWRLEVMPDVVQTTDPFAKPSLEKEVMHIIEGEWPMTLHLPGLGSGFGVTGLNSGNTFAATARGNTIEGLRPGVYLLCRKETPSARWTAGSEWKNIRLGEYTAPRTKEEKGFIVRHTPQACTSAGQPLEIEATVAGNHRPDSVIIYTDEVSFWNEHNPYIKMKHTEGYTWRATLPETNVKVDRLRYNIVVFRGEERQTFPSGTRRSPLDWDYTATDMWETRVVEPQTPMVLLEHSSDGLETYMLPEWGGYIHRQTIDNGPIEKPTLRLAFKSDEKDPVFFLRRYIKEEVDGRRSRLADCRTLCLHLRQVPEGLKAGFITSSGYTYLSECPEAGDDGIVRIPLSGLKQSATLLPAAYPSFLTPYFRPQTDIPFKVEDIDMLFISFEAASGLEKILEIGQVWLE